LIAEREHVREDLVARSEARHGAPDSLDDARDIQADSMVSGCPQAHEEADEGRPRRQAVEVGTIDGCRVHANEDLTVGWCRLLDVVKPDDVRRTIPITNRRLHRCTVAATLGSQDADERRR
jgi:hypothetical protein